MSHPLTVYKASAGSGKTFTLAIEYIKLLVLSTDIDEFTHILGVTFTNKATTEMKDRIISQLYGIAHGLPASEPYMNALRRALQGEPDAPPSDADIRQRCAMALHQILHDYSRFRVQTIDAFFQSILRGLAHELGLTANLQVEISDTEVLSEAVDRIVSRLQDEPVVLDWLLSLVRDQIENGQRWDVTRRVKDFGRTIFNEEYLRRGEQLRVVLADRDFVKGFIRQLKAQITEGEEFLRIKGQQIEQTVAEAGITYADFSNGQRILSGLVEKLKAGSMAEVELSATVQKWADDPLLMVKKADQTRRPDLLDAADSVSGILAMLAAELPEKQYATNSAQLALAHLKPLFLLDFIDREVADINAETSRFNLAKTPILLNRMIGDTDAPFIFEKMGALLHHVMIDEFQDTSRLQWENFRSLLLESYSRGGRNLLVGDVKQSIYRWRGGDWRTLGGIEKQVSPTPLVHTLDTNYRSQRNVIQFNNDFFTAASAALDAVSQPEEALLGQPQFFAQAYADVVQQCPEGKPEGGYVRVQVLDSEEYKNREGWEPAILEDLKEQVRRLHEAGLPYEQMTILVRKNFQAAPIIEAFAADPQMPPIVSDEAFLLSSSLPVCLLIHALRLLENADDRVATELLRRHDIDTERLAQERDRLRLMPLYELMEHLYRQLNLQRFPEQDAYFMAFFDAVAEYMCTEAAGLHTFLQYWNDRLSQQSIPAGQVSGIRIITIHKAKGLEFHTVFMPFCNWELERDRSSSLLWCTPTQAPYDALQLIPITPRAKTTPNSVFARDYAEEHLLSRLDELNALYVGFTRARSNLYIWAVGADLAPASRTVGDLIACCTEQPEVGTPVTTCRQTTDEETNRMTLRPTPIPVTMQSYDLNIQFRQSTKAREFCLTPESSSLTPNPSPIGEGSIYSQELKVNDKRVAQVTTPLSNRRGVGGEAGVGSEARSSSYLATGRLLHRVLQQIATAADIPAVLDAFEQEGLISGCADDGTAVTVRRRDMQRWLDQGLRNPVVGSWFSGEWQLFRECSIVSLNAQGAPEVHRPDRVLVNPDQQQVIVIDFKFGHPAPAHEAQVTGYMHLLQQMLPTATVTGYLWYVYSGHVQTIPNNQH